MTPLKLIIDTDPGQDDAVAILLALAERERIELLGITTVAGNAPVEMTTVNALRILELARRPEVPVFRGASRPLLRPLLTGQFICGADGLDGAALPRPSKMPHDRHAVSFLIETLRSAADRSITICALAPLTNLALAFAQAPELAVKIDRIVMMGGARDLGNITPAAEFNFYVDPHSAHIVLTLGVPIVMLGLHATHQALATPDRLAPIAALDNAVSSAVMGMMTRPRPGGRARFGVEAHPLHDPCTVAYLLWPEIFPSRACAVTVEVASEETIGRSTIDWWGSGKRKPNAEVVERIDAEELFTRLARSLAKLDR
ncbi:MAG TPA: nucleoside hydrolase [Stellaceae bacterium]|nr:nucleoside hydrolase [Stellaceae bacterium]